MTTPLPRDYEEAAKASITTYEAQIAILESWIDSETENVINVIAKTADDSTDDLLIEAIVILIGAKQESIKVLREALQA